MLRNSEVLHNLSDSTFDFWLLNYWEPGSSVPAYALATAGRLGAFLIIHQIRYI
jgi:hypothetical protein